MKKDNGSDAPSTEVREWRYVGRCSKLTAFLYVSLCSGNALLIAHTAMNANAPGKAELDPFQLEMQRRRLWACYMMTAYSSDPYLQRCTFQLVKDIRLPCREEDFNPGMASPESSTSSDCESASITGEIIRIVCLWQVYPWIIMRSPLPSVFP